MVGDTPQVMTRRDLEAKIIALAWQDDDFRRKFIADPKGQFEELLGTKFPESLRITAHEEDENNFHFVIPMKPKANVEELTDEQLQKVAGGTSTYSSIDGFDLVWQQQILQAQQQTGMTSVYTLEANPNLSDTEKMFGIQMAMNTWASIANLRTNMLKSVSDTLKALGRNSE